MNGIDVLKLLSRMAILAVVHCKNCIAKLNKFPLVNTVQLCQQRNLFESIYFFLKTTIGIVWLKKFDRIDVTCLSQLCTCLM